MDRSLRAQAVVKRIRIGQHLRVEEMVETQGGFRRRRFTCGFVLR